MSGGQTAFKILTQSQWDSFVNDGVFQGSADDIRDGFIHLSTAAQLEGTLAKHFAGASDLRIAEIALDRFGEALKWEEARDGALFPHLYRPLEWADVIGHSDVSLR